MTRILFNCDDLGKNRAVNGAILKAHRDGVLGSASLMVTGEALDEAIAIAKSNSKLKVGLHLVLSEATPALPREKVLRLVADDGNFFSDPAVAGIRLAWDGQARAQAAAEIEAQFRKFMETGINPAHVDGHHHLHMHPFIFRECSKWAAHFKFPRIRIAREWGEPLPPRRDGRAFAAKIFRHFIFRSLCGFAGRTARRNGLQFLQGVLGLWESGRMSESYLLQSLPLLPEGDWEVYVHVGGDGCEEELEGMLSPRVREMLEKRGIGPL